MTNLEISNEKVTFKDLVKRVDKARKLVAISLDNVTIDGSERDMVDFSKSVRGLPDLEEFSLVNVKVIDAEVNLDQVVSMLLVTVDNLTTVKLEKVPVTSSSLAAIGYCSSVKNLLLTNSGWNDEDAIKIAAAVAQNSSVEKIDLTGNDLSDTGCVAFANAVNKNTSLQEVKLDGNGKISGTELNKIQGTLQERISAGATAA